MKFQVGDVVRLKSGGPQMTVEGYEKDRVICAWFEGTDLKRKTFVDGTLDKEE